MTVSEHRVFVSHSHLDNEFGMKLAQDLRHALTEDSAVFYDVLGGLHVGDTWWEKIIEELTARDVFLLILSPDAMNSPWVRREINMAIHQDKLILPVLYRTCDIRADLKTIQITSFLAPKSYETAFQDILVALHLSVETPLVPKKPIDTDQPHDPATRLMHHMETAFIDHDWPDVIRKAEYLMKHMPESMTALAYRWQGVAFVEEGEVVQAQEAFQTALALVSDRQERLTLLSDYTALLVRQQQWVKVLQRAREALHLVPQDAAWQAIQQQAQGQLAQQTSRTTPTQKPEHPSEFYSQIGKKGSERDKAVAEDSKQEEKHFSTPPKTKEQWFNEGNTLYRLKRYEEAISAYEQVIRLDPSYAYAYYNKGNALRDLDLHEDALSIYKQALRLDPNLAFTYNKKGDIEGLDKIYEV